MNNKWFNSSKFHEERVHSEHEIEEEVFEALKRNPGVQVHADQRVITLRGNVPSAKEADAMVDLVQHIPGVQQVINELQVSA